MPVKPAHPKQDEGPITRGKGLDTLERFIIQNWAPPTRFGVWRPYSGALAPAKGSLAPFLDATLKEGWLRDGSGAVITIDPPGEAFVTIRVESENKVWTPESHYHPKHWVWKAVAVPGCLPCLDADLGATLPDPEASYLRGLREGRLKDAWDTALG